MLSLFYLITFNDSSPSSGMVYSVNTRDSGTLYVLTQYGKLKDVYTVFSSEKLLDEQIRIVIEGETYGDHNVLVWQTSLLGKLYMKKYMKRDFYSDYPVNVDDFDTEISMNILIPILFYKMIRVMIVVSLCSVLISFLRIWVEKKS